MKVSMGFPMIILVLLYSFKIYLQEEVEKELNECLSHIEKSSNELELFESLNKIKFFKQSNLHAIDQ